MLDSVLLERSSKLLNKNIKTIKDDLKDEGELSDAQETAVGITAFWMTQLDLSQGKTGNE